MWTSWKISAKGLCAHNCNCNCTTAIPPQQWNEWLRKDSMKTSICYITVTVTWQTQPQQHQHVTARGVEVWVCGGTVLNGWLSGRISSVQYMQYILLLFRLLLLRCAVYVCSACARWKEWKLVNTGYAAVAVMLLAAVADQRTAVPLWHGVTTITRELGKSLLNNNMTMIFLY